MQFRQAQGVTILCRELGLRAIEYGHIHDLSDVGVTLLDQNTSAIAAPLAVP